MSTPDTINIKTEFGEKEPNTPKDITRFTHYINKEEEDSASSDGDSSDNELPLWVTDSQVEKYRKKYGAPSDNNTNLSALSGVSTSDIDVSVSESNRDEIDETALSGRTTVSESGKTEATAQQNVIEAEHEVAAAQDEDDNIRRDIEENTYIRTHINGVLDGDDDVLFMKLSSPDPDNDATIFYEKMYNTNDTDQKELIPFIFLFAKTYKKIDDSVKAINSLLQEDNKISEINSQLTTLQGQLQMFYELPLQHTDGEQLISNPDYYFGENQPSVIIVQDKLQIFFQTTDGQKDWEDFMEYFNNNVSASYKKGKVQFEPNAKKSVKQFKEKYLTKKSSSIMSKMGSMFGSRQGGNKKQTRRPVIHKKRQTRRK